MQNLLRTARGNAVLSSLLDRVVIMPTEKKGRVPFDAERVKPVCRY